MIAQVALETPGSRGAVAASVRHEDLAVERGQTLIVLAVNVVTKFHRVVFLAKIRRLRNLFANKWLRFLDDSATPELQVPLKAADTIRMPAEFFGKNFDRHVAFEFRIARTVNLAHSPAADETRNDVRAELRSDSDRHESWTEL